MAVLNSGLMLLGVGADQTQVIKGLVLLAAVAFDVHNKNQGRPSIIGRLMSSFNGANGSKAAAGSADAVTVSGALPPDDPTAVDAKDAMPTTKP